MSEMPELGNSEQGISRRTVTKAMAWAVPVVAVAAAAPTAAASCIPTLTLSPRSCKCPGQSTNSPFTYNLYMCAGGQSCPESSLSVTVKKVVKRNSGDVLWSGTQAIPTGTCYLFTGSTTDSGTWIDVTYSVAGGADQVASFQSPPNCDKVTDPVSTCVA